MLERFAVALPDGLHNTNVGNIVADSLPLTSMLCCLPTLTLFWRRGRVLDLVVLFIGFALACIYHVCHMAPEGLVASKVLGVSGPVWRSLDVLFAQWLLGRTFGHAVAATHSVPVGVTNAAFPALLLHRGLTGGPLSVPACARALAATLAATLACKLVTEGAASLPRYPAARGFSTVALFVAAFVAFPMPELFPRHYWLFHSLWHAFLGAGYYELYAMLEDQRWVEHNGRPVSRTKDSPAAINKQPSIALAEQSCSENLPCSARQTAHILARCDTSEEPSAPRMVQPRRRRQPPSEECFAPRLHLQQRRRPLLREADVMVQDLPPVTKASTTTSEESFAPRMVKSRRRHQAPLREADVVVQDLPQLREADVLVQDLSPVREADVVVDGQSTVREADVVVEGRGRPLERALSGTVPWQQAQHLMVFSRSLKRLARLVCLHS